MADVCVITGGGSGIGLAAAKFMPKEKIILIAGRTEAKLAKAVKELDSLGYRAYYKTCDTSDRASVRALAEYAQTLGTVRNVINAAGLSPAMAKPEQLIKVNALGTVYVDQEFSRVMGRGSVIVNVSSNSAYALPKLMIPKSAYKLADTNENEFLRRMIKRSSLPKGDYQRSGLAYALSKNFAVWYAQKSAFELGKSGIRVVSLSPGLISTDMGALEANEGEKMLRFGAEQRMGTPDELGFAIASAADERNGYLSGVDILCDGGCTNGKLFRN